MSRTNWVPDLCIGVNGVEDVKLFMITRVPLMEIGGT